MFLAILRFEGRIPKQSFGRRQLSGAYKNRKNCQKVKGSRQYGRQNGLLSASLKTSYGGKNRN